MSNDTNLIISSLERIFSDADSLKQNHRELWEILHSNGFTQILYSQSQEDVVIPISDCLPIIALSGQYCLPVPYAETLLASFLLGESGLEIPESPLGVVMEEGGSFTLSFSDKISHAVGVQHIDDRTHIILYGDVESAIVPISLGVDGKAYFLPEKAKTVAKILPPCWLDKDCFLALGAAFRAAQISGALQAAFSMTLDYTQMREQFGRPLSKFQAIQHHLATMACEVAASNAGIAMMAEKIRQFPNINHETIEEIAMAKIRNGDAVTHVAAIAHQCHGAMGYSEEYGLGNITRHLWQWQDEFGSADYWAIRLGHDLLGADKRLWARLSI